MRHALRSPKQRSRTLKDLMRAVFYLFEKVSNVRAVAIMQALDENFMSLLARLHVR